jgi:hypothetical protein
MNNLREPLKRNFIDTVLQECREFTSYEDFDIWNGNLKDIFSLLKSYKSLFKELEYDGDIFLQNPLPTKRRRIKRALEYIKDIMEAEREE